MARARYQVLVIPYCIQDGNVQFCLFRRSDMGIWQFIAGGGEEDDISDIIEKYFSGVQLPLNDEQLEQMYESVNKANKNIWKNKSAPDEFHDVVVRYMVDNFNDRKYIY